MLRALVPSLAALAILAGPAAAEDFDATLSAAKPSFSWSGYAAGGPGFECSNEADFQCDAVKLTLADPGDLAIAIDVEGEMIGPYPNVDLTLYDAGGKVVAESATPVDDEKLDVKGLAAGTYLIEVRSALSIGENYSGKLKLSNFPKPAVAPPAAAPPAAPAAQPAPAQPAPARPAAKKPSRKAACRAKAKKIKSKSRRSRALKRCAKLK